VRKPVSIGFAQSFSGLCDGKGASGVRRCPPQMNSLMVGTAVPGFSPGATRDVL